MAEKSYQLTERRGPKPGEIFPLTLDTIIIGRDPGATIVLNDPEVSRQHAQLKRTAAGYQLQDMGSTNGTFIDGARLGGEPVTLSPGQMITLGSNVTLIFQAIASFDPMATMVAPVEAPPALTPVEEVKPTAALVEPVAPAEPPAPIVEPPADEFATSLDWPRPAELPAAEPMPLPSLEEKPLPSFEEKPPPAPSYDYAATPPPAYEPPPSTYQPPSPTTPEKGTTAGGRNRNRNRIIIVAVVLFLLCCCVVAIVLVVAAYSIFGDPNFNFQGALNELFNLRLALL